MRVFCWGKGKGGIPIAVFFFASLGRLSFTRRGPPSHHAHTARCTRSVMMGGAWRGVAAAVFSPSIMHRVQRALVPPTAAQRLHSPRGVFTPRKLVQSTPYYTVLRGITPVLHRKFCNFRAYFDIFWYYITRITL